MYFKCGFYELPTFPIIFYYELKSSADVFVTVYSSRNITATEVKRREPSNVQLIFNRKLFQQNLHIIISVVKCMLIKKLLILILTQKPEIIPRIPTIISARKFTNN
ncbi:hypothetical protein WUBG_14011 [Wuchereria bancrofti]|uniref:Uncharacterized protein n=1 Tax=Wuchereria bancrofti TaxID=6293 RepID=J9DZ70_WUCBA|nr:hypothetical protein WUBG_14011 [Wuchereria bancrofti]